MKKKGTKEDATILRGLDLHQAELAAIRKRLKAGKTITAAQQRLLHAEDNVAEPGCYTMTELTGLTGHHANTLRKALVHLTPVRVKGHVKHYRLADVEAALVHNRGSIAGLREEKLRGEKLENERREMELAEKRQELISVHEVQAMWGNILLVIRQRIQSLPHEACTTTNPTDPKHALAALQEWSDSANRLITQHLPQLIKGEPEDQVHVEPWPATEIITVAKRHAP